MKRSQLLTVIQIFVVGAVAWLLFAPHPAAAGIVAQAEALPQSNQGDAADLLGPILLAATAVERLLEAFWSWVEGIGSRIIKILGLAGQWVQLAREDVQRTEQALVGLVEDTRKLIKAGVPATDQQRISLAGQIQVAENALLDAQRQLQAALKSDTYVRIKQAISILAGIVLGVIIAFQTGLNIFSLLNVPQFAPIVIGPISFSIGMFITGLLIGTGSGPVHTTIGLIQQTRELFAGRRVESLVAAFAGATHAKAAASGAPQEGLRALADANVAPATAPVVTAEDLRTIQRLASTR